MNAKLPSLLLLSIAVACSNENAPQRVTDTSPAPGPGAAPKTTPAAAPMAPGELGFTTPAGWIAESPDNPMRKLQFRLPHVEGDSEDAQLWVTGPVGGGQEQNVKRWIDEFEQPDGQPVKDVIRTPRKVGGLDILEIDLSGTCRVSSMASPTVEKKTNWRQIASSIEKAGDNVGYVKLRGPKATVAHWEKSYREFVDSGKSAK